MKEESTNKKLPPKMFGASTSAKISNDDILSNLLRINNFDSISSIKDESLDIDLSACVTISADPSGIINSNSQSATDFWRVLDESAQNSQLDLLTGNDEEVASLNLKEENMNTTSFSNYRKEDQIENKKLNTFTGTFLRPDPPAAFSVSPLKKKTKALPAEQSQHTLKMLSVTAEDCKKLSTLSAIKDPPKHLISTRYSVAADNKSKKDNLVLTSSLRSNDLSSSLPPSENAIMHLQTKFNDAEDSTLTLSEPMYKCLDCNDLLLSGHQEFATHNLASHRIRYKCKLCERDFEQESGLKKHLKTHRSVDTKKDAWKKCPECGKCLKLGSLWMHRKIHSDNKKYCCDICGQKFVQKINLTHHSRVHPAEKPYECPECQKRFQERSHLQRHQKYHAQTRSYRCEKCGKMYKTERCLKVHNLVHLEQRPFACNVCEKSFISNSKLKQHSNIHTGERPFKCNYCPRDFTNFPNWLKHTRRRHKVDHKTGEHLENIPSYCSKKSSKSTKSQKSTEVIIKGLEVAPKNVPMKDEDITKNQNKRKKKEDTSADNVESTTAQKITSAIAAPKATITSGTMPVGNKSVKTKRERKQLTPKQVQKAPASQICVKEEVSEFKTAPHAQGSCNFPDLHCLSITSAEELIMEQALEMEECGLYISPSAVNSDNLSWSNTTQNSQFKIKNEFPSEEMHEDKISLNRDGTKQCVHSSTIENLEFSPTSIEITSTNLMSSSNSTSTNVRVPVTNIYSPIYPFNSLNGNSNSESNVSNFKLIQAVPSNTMNSNSTLVQTDQRQAFINQFYFPMTTVSVQTHQVLPSVDTLFSSNTSNISYFLSKEATTQKLS